MPGIEPHVIERDKIAKSLTSKMMNRISEIKSTDEITTLREENK